MHLLFTIYMCDLIDYHIYIYIYIAEYQGVSQFGS